jgi:uncharacterized protein YprB with RNaseH-like and TPR domain
MFNPMNCSRKELLERMNFSCVHSHNGIVHPKCFDLKKNGYKEKIAFLDIEAESLDADFGIVFCWVIKDCTGKVLKDCITKADMTRGKVAVPTMQPKEDKRVVDSLLSALRGYDRVVAHYGCGYDIPFVRTRAVINGLDFPKFGDLFQSDTWMMLKKKFKLSRNSLENGTRTLLGKSRKNRLSLSLRHGCLRGEKWALDYTLNHCVKDVEDLFDLYYKIHKFSRKTKSSI